MSVPVRELKANLSEVLSRAQNGEIIEVTSHNKPVARIIGIPAADTHPLGELAADKSVTWNGKKPSFAKHLPQLSAGGKSLSKIIQEDRT
jgi:prevent-host-death family protein